LAVLEKQMCNEKGEWLSGNPEEIEKILAELHEKPDNAKAVKLVCSKYGTPAWLYSVNVFQGIQRIGVHPLRLSEIKSRIVKVDDFEVCLIQDEGGFSATVASLPGCISQGESEEEAINNVKDAIGCYIETAKKYGIAIRR